MEHYAANTTRRRQAGQGFSSRTGRRSAGKNRSHRQERIRLLQLLVCLAVFLVVFIGRGVFPERLLLVRDNLLSLISSDADFQAAFSDLGESMAQEESLLDQLGEFCIQVFGAAEEETEQAPVQAVPKLTSLLDQEQQFLSEAPDQETLAGHFFYKDGLEPPEVQEPVQVEPAQEGPAPEEVEPVAEVGAVVQVSDYDGQALPENYTMDCLSLGALETTTPVLGKLTSPYGYRDHPVNGKYLFHAGVDIKGATGTPIQCFADGTVEFVGENDSYGLYLQVDHGNGVKSFYAHCSSICVKKGQTVAMGEKLGEVGDTGLATASHLHLELQCAGVHVDPAYYIDLLSDQ